MFEELWVGELVALNVPSSADFSSKLPLSVDSRSYLQNIFTVKNNLLCWIEYYFISCWLKIPEAMLKTNLRWLFFIFYLAFMLHYISSNLLLQPTFSIPCFFPTLGSREEVSRRYSKLPVS